jgi:hypothetical protein
LGVQINFIFRQPVSVNSNGTNPIKSFLINFPPLFENAVKIPADFINNNTKLSIMSVDYSNPDFIVVYTDRSAKIDSGQYGFRFPVHVPYQLSDDNVWFVSLCGDGGNCSGLDDPGVITSIPIPGFAIGQDNAYTRVDEFKSVDARWSWSIWCTILILLATLGW